jgi:hypothetical protein
MIHDFLELIEQPEYRFICNSTEAQLPAFRKKDGVRYGR